MGCYQVDGIGYSAIAEYTYAISPAYLIGLRTGARLYTTYDANIDVHLKVGMRIL